MKRAPRDLPPDLRLGDVTLFFAVQRCGTVTGAARALRTSPSHVSKAVSRLEAQLGVTLLTRGVRGVTLTDGALRLLPDLERALAAFSRAINSNAEGARTLSVAGPSWVVALLLPVMARVLPHLRLCALELPPATLRAHVAENFFDLCFLVGRAQLPPAWDARPIGDLRFGLVARPELAQRLAPAPVPVEKLRAVPFITPVYSVNGQFVRADDDCPLAFSQRRLGHQVQTLAVAHELALSVDQLVFGPLIAAWRHLEAGDLVELPVRGWKVTESLWLACNPERLLAQEHAAIVGAIRDALGRSAASTLR